MLNIIGWIILGALAGWIASIIMGTNEEQGGIANIIVGIVGALLGGIISNALGGPGISGFNLSSLIVAILGSVLLLFVVNLFRRRPAING